MQDNSFDKNIRQKLDGFNVEPSQQVWTEVEKELDGKKRRYFFLWWLLPLLIIGGGAMLYTNKIQNSNKENNSTQVAQISAATKKITATEDQMPSGTEQVTESVQDAGTTPTGTGRQDDINPRSTTKTNPGKTNIHITTTVADDDADGIFTVNKKNRKIGGKTKVSIKPATAQDEDATESTDLDISKNDTISIVIKDGRNTFFDSTAVATVTKPQVTGNISDPKQVDSLPANTSDKERKKPSSKWDTQWAIGGGYAGLGTLKIGASANEAFFNNGGITDPNNPGNGLRISNKYSFNNGVHLSAGILINRKLSNKFKLSAGLQYNFQHINVNRKYMIDSVALSGTPSYTNLNTTVYKESLDIHSIDIPVLLKWSLSQRISLSTGLINRFQFAGRWKKYANILGDQSTYLPMLHFNPEYNFKNFSLGPVINIGLTQYNNGTRLMNIGLSFKYSPKK